MRNEIQCVGPCGRKLHPSYFTPGEVKRPGKSKKCRSCAQVENAKRRLSAGKVPGYNGFRDFTMGKNQ